MRLSIRLPNANVNRWSDLMTTFPNSPRLLKGGIVLIDPMTSVVLRIIALQHNPDTLSRTTQRLIALQQH